MVVAQRADALCCPGLLVRRAALIAVENRGDPSIRFNPCQRANDFHEIIVGDIPMPTSANLLKLYLRNQADITAIIRELHKVVEGAITTKASAGEPSVVYDISKIDFERLRQEFERSPAKKTTVQSLKAVIEQRLQRLIAQNPLRTNFQAHYQEIVAEYNQEKDRVTIEHTFEQLLRFVQTLDTEEARAIREGLDVETVAIYDLLTKPSLDAKEISRIKEVAVALLGTPRRLL